MTIEGPVAAGLPVAIAGGTPQRAAPAHLLFELDAGRVRANAQAAALLSLANGRSAALQLPMLMALLDGASAARLAASLAALATVAGAAAPATRLLLAPRHGGALDLLLERLAGDPPAIALGTLLLPEHAELETQPQASPGHSTTRREDPVRAGHAGLAVLAGGIAHDFNNLLVGVMGNLDLARYADDVGSGTQRHLDAALAAAERAAELCRQLLAFAGNGPVRAQVKDINDELRRVAPLLRQSVGQVARLVIDAGGGALPAALDSGLFVQLLLNLLANAAEASPNDGEIRVFTRPLELASAEAAAGTTLRIVGPDGASCDALWIGHEPAAGRYVQLGVADKGSGMTADVRARAFDPLFSTRGDGRGLGLPAVQGIVRQHGGCIGVSTEPGKGTIIAVLWPAGQGGAGSTARTPRRPREGTVLIVDDEPTVRDVLRLQLERLGYRTRAVENGLLALEHVREHGAELLAVVLDQTMPVMGGAEAYRHLREIAPRLPLVLTTGYGESNLLELIAGDAHAAFLPKPFALGRLREVLEHVTS